VSGGFWSPLDPSDQVLSNQEPSRSCHRAQIYGMNMGCGDLPEVPWAKGFRSTQTGNYGLYCAVSRTRASQRDEPLKQWTGAILKFQSIQLTHVS
jgi:hypothetical protein